jgi:hypothetical protein
MTNPSLRRVLTLDIRPRRFGYAVFEGPDLLLDWGIRTHGEDERSSLERSLSNLRSMFSPSVILIRKSAKSSQIKQPRIDRAFRIVKHFAKHMLVRVQLVDASLLRGFFSRDATADKHDIARTVAERFPQLSWRLPPKRKPWQSESKRQSIFDAASVGVYYFARQANGHETAIPLLG